MIDPKELRIGNLVNTQDGHGVVRAVNLFIATVDVMNCISEFTDDTLSPIPISPEWLERFGLKIGGDFLGYAVHKDGADIHIYKGHNCMSVYIKSVHQLQNLYFALTGQELTIKELEPKA